MLTSEVLDAYAANAAVIHANAATMVTGDDDDDELLSDGDVADRGSDDSEEEEDEEHDGYYRPSISISTTLIWGAEMIVLFSPVLE